ncbi:vitamin B12 ABC transporter permease BtuC [Thaumasiovibrio sp. DFM-14]|uniref:vitamin B12 ABC transporter permease BtuC n=1 Tax=Thaumasiovibrio sp. DFM-14 TaxID=3384792 RepID=UPI0039A17706
MELQQLNQNHAARWRKAIWLILTALIGVCLIGVAAGEQWIWPLSSLSEFESLLVWQLRLPRVVAAFAVGAMLATSGASLQVVLGNPLAEPGILGVSGGASLFVIILMFFFPHFTHPYLMMVLAIAGALVFTFILVSLSAWRRLTTARMLLIGIALGILANSVVTWVFYFSADMNLRQLLYWLMGSVSGITWPQLSILLLLFPVVAWLCTQGRLLDTLLLGDVMASQLGVDTRAVRLKLIAVIAVLVGGSVALAGVIGFIGLVIPHILRLWIGTEHRYLLPLSALAGGGLLVFADTLSRLLLVSAELPVGVVTATLGAPVFVWLLLRGDSDA